MAAFIFVSINVLSWLLRESPKALIAMRLSGCVMAPRMTAARMLMSGLLLLSSVSAVSIAWSRLTGVWNWFQLASAMRTADWTIVDSEDWRSRMVWKCSAWPSLLIPMMR